MIYKAVVAYDGWNYAGWQKQANALGIQEVIEKALSQINRKETRIIASGRTDAKVHAWGQVFHFDPLDSMSPQAYFQALNTRLPKDIRIQSIEQVPDSFHARFSTRSKRYDFICTTNAKDPFSYRYKQLVWQDLDIEAMKAASHYLLGTHDFTSFCSSRVEEKKTKRKTITRIEIQVEGSDIRTIFEGSGFLRYQVRMMMGTLIEVGKHRLEPLDVKKILDAKNKEACRYNAQPQGLYLMKVNY